jgi:chaperonin GroES
MGKIEAVNNVVLVKRIESESMSGGLYVPDSAKKKPHKGEIISVGVFVTDKKIKVGKIAAFNQHSGHPLEVGDDEIYVLRDNEILFVL